MRRLLALIKKEFLQIMRDPSSLLIAGVLPLLLLFIFGYGVNLDSNKVRIGLVQEDTSYEAYSLVYSFVHSPFLETTIARDRRELNDLLVNGRVRGLVIIPQDFSRAYGTEGHSPAQLQVITDGTEPNIASFVQNYAEGVVRVWLAHQGDDQGSLTPASRIQVEPRFWYNPELKSRNFLIPGSIAIIMTLIGSLLTALVIAREWERGTMEALMATPVSISQLLLGKLIPYFILAVCSMLVCLVITVWWYEVPFRGSFLALLAATSVFLLAALGQGLLISTLSKDQFLASQLAMISAYLPAFMLSGFIFEIASMPVPLQALTRVFAVRYFVTSLQSLFLVGTVWPLLLRCMACMGVLGVVFLWATAKKTVRRLD